MIDLDRQHIEEVKRILRKHVPEIEVRAFGSRIDGTARAYSDLDLVLIGKGRLDWHRIEALKDAFAESDLPFLVDVVDWNAISMSFRKIIEKRYVVVQEA